MAPTNVLPPAMLVHRTTLNAFEALWKVPNSGTRFFVGSYYDRAAAVAAAKAFYERVRHITNDDEVDAFVGNIDNYLPVCFHPPTRTVEHGQVTWVQRLAKYRASVQIAGKKKFVGHFWTLAECNEANKAVLEKHRGANEAFRRAKREEARDKFVARMAKARWARATKRAKRSREAEWSDPWELPEAKRAARWNAQICHAEASFPLRTVLLPYYVSATSV